MIKKNKQKLLLSSLMILLPILFGFVFWNKLPEQMVTHWGVDGKADGWSSRNFAVFALPFFILIVHWFCILCTSRDARNKEQSNKIFRILFWTCPLVSIVASGMIYAVALGKELEAHVIVYLLVGFFFVIIGNYLPKCKQNHTIGIRVKWTLENEENWNATHRFSGKVWAVGGVLMMGCSFLPEEISIDVFLAVVVALSVVSVGYSYYYYKTRQSR